MEGKQESEIEVIHSWSAPRSLSTSVMYSFAQRDDIEVLDEPLYANFLRVTGVERPYRDEVLSKMEADGNKVVKDVIFGPGVKKYRFCKHISKQRVPGLSDELMKRGKHFILIRNPLEVLLSFDKVVRPSFLELGLADLIAIYNELCNLGKRPPIIDVAELREDPEAALRWLCQDLDIPFQAAMLNLHYDAGLSACPHASPLILAFTDSRQWRWYFVPFPSSLYDLLEQSLPLYNMLKRHTRGKSSLGPQLPRPSLPVPANEKLLVWVGDEILPRDSAKVPLHESHKDKYCGKLSIEAVFWLFLCSLDKFLKVSVLDSVVQGGDSVWEGLRVYDGRILKLDEHLDRLFDSAKALAFNNVPTREEVTSGMNPSFNLYGCTLIVLAEWKPPVYDNTKGITLVSATTRRNSPNNLDSKIHHNNLLNNILAKIEGNNANADEAIMLDNDGYVSETNATNIFLVKKGRVVTPHADYCLPGITRATVMDLLAKERIILEERRVSLSEFHTADEVYIFIHDGFLGQIVTVAWTQVVKIDGRIIGDGHVGPVTQRLQSAFTKLTEESGVPIPTYRKA
ncbi:hypothetical protein RHSIM_Rhsim05G0144300 [Rhododendron simsii]|uniref:Uncharacterized protein n=1 Tax=Rhododendron simsii TaxID=118357 RepID=A0A834LPN6_RHOSS|nr:hypothetical protein RHSIM_Rhsim05G0144300 [Rhododendron simsii]